MNDERLGRKVALITGAGGGLGRAMALALARAGARIMAADVAEDQARATARSVEDAGGSARFAQADVTDAEAVERMVQATVDWGGRLDYAINNAGIGGASARTADYPEAEWHRVIAINLTGVWLCMRSEIPRMLAQGGGVIVNVASVAGIVALASNSAYTASKHGVVGLTKAAALEYVRSGIRINALCPGFTRTPMVEQLIESRPQLAERLPRSMPIGRLGTPEEIADAVVYLCSDGAAFMVGHALVLDGGIAAQ
jgi:NAD(P)-dependent dehydrogenase (short-subunit alcohol dehydrogenase family)